MSLRYSYVVMVLSLMLNGCVTAPRVVGTTDHAIANQAVATSTVQALPLLSPASLGSSHQVEQSLHGEYGDQHFSLRCVVSVNAEKLSVICLTAMGLRAFTLSYDGKNITEQRAPQVPDSLQAIRLVNDLQLAFWPLNVIQQSWQATGVQVIEPYAGTRRVLREDKVIAEVHYSKDPWQGRVWLHQNQIGYSLYIESAAQ